MKSLVQKEDFIPWPSTRFAVVPNIFYAPAALDFVVNLKLWSGRLGFLELLVLGCCQHYLLIWSWTWNEVFLKEFVGFILSRIAFNASLSFWPKNIIFKRKIISLRPWWWFCLLNDNIYILFLIKLFSPYKWFHFVI